MLPAALIFDVDGTLAETEELHRRSFNAAFTAAGLDWHWSMRDYTQLLTTTGGKERIARFIAEIGAPPVDIPALHADKTRRYAALMAEGNLQLRPGIAELIAQARAQGLKLAVATTTSRPNVDALCAACFGRPADACFDVLACGDEVSAKKPAPDVYLLALDRLGLAADQAIAFEDSSMGLASAQAAGLRCIVSPGLYTASDDTTAADRRVNCFSALLPDGLEGLLAA